ncbi:MAG: glycoside hydrolase family 65 protein, partial [Armatimonadota bacterium]
NRMVRFALELASRVGSKVGVPEQECADFARAAALLPIPRRADGLVLQCEEFESLAEPRFDELWKDRTRAFASQVSQERLYRSKCLKQADVLMMMLFPEEFNLQEIAQAWEYYLPYTTHDSSLSAGAHAIVACRLGLREQAWEFW